MSSDNTAVANSELPNKTYRGPPKLVWEDGRQVIRPDFEAAANGTPGALQQSFIATKTLDDVVSAADEKLFSQLKNDDQKYDMIVNLVSGVDHRSELFTSRYVHGDPRDLKDILKDLIDQKRIYLNQKDGNIYEYNLAIREHMISFKCRGGMLSWTRWKKRGTYASRYKKNNNEAMRRILSTRISN